MNDDINRKSDIYADICSESGACVYQREHVRQLSVHCNWFWIPEADQLPGEAYLKSRASRLTPRLASQLIARSLKCLWMGRGDPRTLSLPWDQFTLSRPISFPNCPSWTELATRFMLSVVFLGVSYVDLDGHEVTLSSYAISTTPVSTTPFQGIGPSDSASSNSSPTRFYSRYRHFIEPLLRNLPHGPRSGDLLSSYSWTMTTSHSMTRLFHREMGSPHAFVEVVDPDLDK